MALQRSDSTANLDGKSSATYADAVRREPSPSPATFQAQVLSMLGGLRSDMQSMGERVSHLERERTQSVPSRTPKGKGKALANAAKTASEAAADRVPTRADNPAATTDEDRDPASSASTSKNWADRDDEIMDFSSELVWDDDEDDPSESKGVKLFKVAEKTEKFLSNSFYTAAPNATRRQWRDKYGAPNTTNTACPSLDKVIKGRLPAATKSRDRQLAKQQALMLDAVGPMTYILEEAVKGQLNQKSVIEAVQTALRLLGNASVHASRERRKNALQSMNTRLLDNG